MNNLCRSYPRNLYPVRSSLIIFFSVKYLFKVKFCYYYFKKLSNIPGLQHKLGVAHRPYSIPYASIPSLQCPVLCSYDLSAWKTLFFISMSIFILALITISLYTIFLRKQYLSLKTRLKKIKYTKVANNITDST